MSDGQIDSREFERLLDEARQAERHGDLAQGLGRRTEAEQLWRGDVLADLPDATFAAPEKARLHELRLSSRETALELELARDRAYDVVADAAELVELYPLRERLWSAFIGALYRTGRQVDALWAYDRYRRILSRNWVWSRPRSCGRSSWRCCARTLRWAPHGPSPTRWPQATSPVPGPA